tara:strand:- start:479 stop:682 length:204 start_codon:yes stop_codon:yes gene_type:complete
MSKESNEPTVWQSTILKNQEKIFDRMGIMREDIATLKVKSGMWGFIAGSIPSAIAILYMIFKSNIAG